MKLELGCVQINDIQFASESKWKTELFMLMQKS